MHKYRFGLKGKKPTWNIYSYKKSKYKPSKTWKFTNENWINWL